jgi:hypothetical protein
MNEPNKAQGLTAAKSGGKASAARREEQATKLERFRAELVERVGNPDPVQQALIDSCCALYLVVLRRCSMTRGVNPKINPLALSAAVTGLRSVLRQLNMTPSTEPTDPNTPPGLGASEEERRAWSQRYVESLVAGERTSS